MTVVCGRREKCKRWATPKQKRGRGENGEETEERKKEERERRYTVKRGVGENTRVENGRPPFLVSSI